MAKRLIRRAGLHWRSLRLHTLLVVLAVALAPVVYVWGIGQVERTTGLNMRREVIQTVRDLDRTPVAVQTIEWYLDPVLWMFLVFVGCLSILFLGYICVLLVWGGS